MIANDCRDILSLAISGTTPHGGLLEEPSYIDYFLMQESCFNTREHCHLRRAEIPVDSLRKGAQQGAAPIVKGTWSHKGVRGIKLGTWGREGHLVSLPQARSGEACPAPGVGVPPGLWVPG